MDSLLLLAAVGDTSNVALVSFCVYLAVVLLLAWVQSIGIEVELRQRIFSRRKIARGLGVCVNVCRNGCFGWKFRRLSRADLLARLGAGVLDCRLHACPVGCDGTFRKTAQPSRPIRRCVDDSRGA